MNKQTFLDQLAARPLCADGGMGTQLLARGMPSGACGMLWNFDRPDDIVAIHRAYREAGCDLLTTNTFGGTETVLENHGLADRTEELNRAAAELARQAAGGSGIVLADVGPFGDFLEPLGEVTRDELRGIFARQISALLDGGADAVLVETMSDPGEAAVGVEAARQVNATAPVIVTYAFQRTAMDEFRTMMGTGVEDAVNAALEAGADVVGANCGTDLTLDDYAELARQLVKAAADHPVIVQPNAGAPKLKNGEAVYDALPEEMAANARQLVDAGVRIVGGCCGTTPDHLAAVVGAIQGGVR